MNCDQFRWLLTASLHGEVDEETRNQLDEHARSCGSCNGLLAFEARFEERLRSVPVVKASDGLRAHLEESLPRTRRNPKLAPLGRPVLWAAAGALAAALALALLPTLTGSSGPQTGEILGTVVCIGCSLRPETTPFHAEHLGLDHVPGLKDDQGRIWHLLRTSRQQEIFGARPAGQRVRIRGTLDPDSRSILLESVMDVPRTGDEVAGLVKTQGV